MAACPETPKDTGSVHQDAALMHIGEQLVDPIADDHDVDKHPPSDLQQQRASRDPDIGGCFYCPYDLAGARSDCAA